MRELSKIFIITICLIIFFEITKQYVFAAETVKPTNETISNQEAKLEGNKNENEYINQDIIKSAIKDIEQTFISNDLKKMTTDFYIENEQEIQTIQFVDNQFIESLDANYIYPLKEDVYLVDLKQIIGGEQANNVLVYFYLNENNQLRVSLFENNEDIFMNLYQSEKTINGYIIGTVFVELLKKNNIVLAGNLLKNATELNSFFEKDKNNKMKLISTVRSDDKNTFLFQYSTSNYFKPKYEEEMYEDSQIQYFSVIKDRESHQYKIDIKNYMAYAYLNKSKFKDESIQKIIEFLYLANHYKDNLDENEIYKSLSKKMKDTIKNNKNTLYYDGLEQNPITKKLSINIRTNQLLSDRHNQIATINLNGFSTLNKMATYDSKTQGAIILFSAIGLFLIIGAITIFVFENNSYGRRSIQNEYRELINNAQREENDFSDEEDINTIQDSIERIIQKPSPQENKVEIENIKSETNRIISVENNEEKDTPSIHLDTKRSIRYDEK